MLLARPGSRQGFTLFELLVILAVLAILIGILVPAIHKVREASNRTRCWNNLRQIVQATHNYEGVNGELPAAFSTEEDHQGTIFFRFLPFVDQHDLFSAAKDDQGNESVWNYATFTKTVPLYLCPADASGGQDHLYQGWLGTGNYAANFLVFGIRGTRFANITDGLSNTIGFTERYQVCNQTPNGWGYAGDTDWAPVVARSTLGLFQTAPTQAQCNPELAQGPHPDGLVIGLLDGSVRSLKPTLSSQSWYLALCPDDGSVMGLDW